MACVFLLQSGFVSGDEIGVQGMNIEKGIKAFEALQYSDALSILAPYAEQGNAEAQYLCGLNLPYG